SVAPRLVSIDPADGNARREGLQTATIRFSEALDPGTVNSTNFELQDSQGNVVPLTNIQTHSGDRLVQMTFAPLAHGSYQIVINSAAVTDRAANALGAAN